MNIQQKILLKAIVELLGSSELTKTFLKRNIMDRSEDQVLDAIERGIHDGILTNASRGGYVKIVEKMLDIQEYDFYLCTEQMLKKYYKTHVNDLGRFMVAKTARKDTKIAGRWTRPDFTVVANRTFPYIRQTEFDIITFEVKRPADCEALAVFEALAHNTAATRSYVFFPMTEKELDGTPQGERIREECVRHGIGLFLVRDSFSLEDAYIVIESQRRPLNPEKCSPFLENVLTSKEKSDLTTWPQ